MVSWRINSTKVLNNISLNKMEKSNEQAETKPCTIHSFRQRFLILCQKQADWDSYDKPTEETEFYRVCNDGLDFVELVMRCEKEFDIELDDFDLNEDSFDTVKDFIDWASSNVAQRSAYCRRWRLEALTFKIK